MKITLKFFIIFIVGVLSLSCSNNSKKVEVEPDSPKKDIKNILEKVENFTSFAQKAIQDNVLNNYEITQLNTFSKELHQLEIEIVEKYSDDENGKEDYDFYIEHHHDKIESTYNEFYSVEEKLYDCKNADKLKLYNH